MRWFYLRDKKKFPVACVVSEKSKTGGIYGEDKSGIFFAVSTYNPIDPFDKRIAREVAMGRLKNGVGTKETSLIIVEKNVKQRILETIATSPTFPTRTRSAAKLWLEKKKAA